LNFELSADQDALRSLTNTILEDRVTRELLRQVDASEGRFDLGSWRALADANILGISLPENLGGSGYGVVEQCLVLEAVGRTLAPVPVWAACVLGAQTVAAFGTPEQQMSWVSRVVQGDVILTAALNEPGGHYGDRPQTRAEPDGDGWRLTGVKSRVPAGSQAAAVIVPARVGTSLGLFIVEIPARGMTVQTQRTTTGDADGRFEFSDVRLEADSLLGSLAEGPVILDSLQRRAEIGLCALQLGICGRALDLTVAYTKTREQFKRPIATFQAVAHRVADCFIDLQAMELTLWQAAYQLDAGLPAGIAVDTAKFWASEGGQRVVHAAVHLHGGVGTDRDGVLHRYFLAAKQVEFTLGGATEHLLSVGDAVAATAAAT